MSKKSTHVPANFRLENRILAAKHEGGITAFEDMCIEVGRIVFVIKGHSMCSGLTVWKKP